MTADGSPEPDPSFADQHCPWCGATTGGRFCTGCGRTLGPSIEARPPVPEAWLGASAGAATPSASPTRWSTGQKAIAGLTVVALIVGTAVGLAASHPSSPRGGRAPVEPTAELSTPLVLHDDAAIPGALFTHPADPGRVVDVTTAETVMAVLWPTRAEALQVGDLETLGRIESHELREVETFAPADGAGQLPTTVDVAWRLAAPPQTAYPASFMAEVHYRAADGTRLTDFLGVMRDGLDESWRIALDTSIQSDEWYLPPTDDATMDTSLDSVGFDHTVERKLPPTLASYFQSWSETGDRPPSGTPGSPFDGTSVAEERGSVIAETAARRRAEGVSAEVTYGSYDGIPVFEAVVGPNLLVCGTVKWTGYHTPVPAGGVIIQSADRHEWGEALAPGRYAQVVQMGARQSCFLSDGQRFIMFGMTGGYTRMDGQEAL